MTLSLYFNWNAVCAMKVVLCLAEKGLDWEHRHIVLSAFEQLDEAYLKINPAGVVPALVHGDVVVLESTVINEYLDDAFPEVRLRPTAPASLAAMRWWNKQVDDTVHPSIRPASFALFVAPRAAQMSSGEIQNLNVRTPKREIAELWRRTAEAPYTEEELAGYIHKIRDLLVQMDARLGQSPWLAGDHYSLADINMTPYFRRLTQLGKTALWTDLPHASAWWERVRRRPSFAVLEELRGRYAPDGASAPRSPAAEGAASG
jgi:glutathione S-transferase